MHQSQRLQVAKSLFTRTVPDGKSQVREISDPLTVRKTGERFTLDEESSVCYP
jgi:hypothetical protein